MDSYFKYIKYKNKYLLYKYDMITRNNIQIGGAFYPIPYRYPFARVKLIPNYISDVEVVNNKLKVYYMNGDIKEYQLNTTNINIDKKEIITHLKEIFADDLKKLDDKFKLLDNIMPQVDERINTATGRILPQVDERINAATGRILPQVDERINAATGRILPQVDERINTATGRILPQVDERINAATGRILPQVDERINAANQKISQGNSTNILPQVDELLDAVSKRFLSEVENRIDAVTGRILPEVAEQIEATNKKISQINDKISGSIPPEFLSKIEASVEERINEVRRIIEERINIIDKPVPAPNINIDEIINTLKKEIMQELTKLPQINKPSNIDSDIILTDTPENVKDDKINKE